MSVNIKDRFNTHMQYLRKNIHPNFKFQKAFDKYGEDSFHLEVLEYCEKDKLVERENFYLDLLKPYLRKNGYNIVENSIDLKRLNETKNSPEAKQKRSKTVKEQWKNADHSYKRIQAIKLSVNKPEIIEFHRKRMLSQLSDPKFIEGRNLWINNQKENESYKKSMSEKVKNLWKDPEYRLKTLEASKEKYEDPKVKESISLGLKKFFSTEQGKKQVKENAKKRWQNPETKEKYIQGMKQRRQDPEYKKMMAEKAKLRWANPEFKAKMALVMKAKKDKGK